MKIGKTIKTVTSPKREVRKAAPAEKPIPVEMPVKVPEKAETEFRFISYYGRAWGKSVIADAARAVMLSSVTS